MITLRSYYLLLFSSLLFTLLGYTQQVKAEANINVNVNREDIGKNQTLRVTVEVKLEGIGGQASVIEPNWSQQGWKVLGRSQSTSMQIFNRQRSSSVNYTFKVRPTRTGKLLLGPFKGNGAASGVTSDIKKINVSDKAPQMSTSQSELNNKYAIVRWEVSPKEVWLGERIDARLMLYVNRQLRLTSFTPPEINLQGFWVEDLEPQQRSPQARMNGYVYVQQELKRSLLSPLKVGTQQLPGMTVELGLSNRGFFSEEESVTQKIKAIPITVKSLPQPAPKGFVGLNVGEVTLKAMVDRTRVRQDEGVQLNVHTSTTGMLANTPAIELPYIDGLRSFPPTQKEFKQERGKKLISKRTQTWLLKPTREGKVVIPSLSMVYFDTKIGQYKTLKTRRYTIDIRGGDPKLRAQPNLNLPANSQKKANKQTKQYKEQTLRSEILGIQLKTIKSKEIIAPLSYDLSWLWILLSILGPFSLIFYEIQKVWTQVNQGKQKRSYHKNAGKHSIEVLRALDVSPLKYGKLYDVLIEYLSIRLGHSLKSDTQEKISQQLKALDVTDDLIESFIGLAQAADFARFAASEVDEKEGKAAVELAITWIEKMELHFNQIPQERLKQVMQKFMLFVCLVMISSLMLASSAWSKTVDTNIKFLMKGNQSFWNGDYQQAIKHYRKELRTHSDEAILWYNLGTAEAHIAHFGEAAFALQQALLLAPYDLESQEQLQRINQAAAEDGSRRPGNRRLVLPDEVLSSGGILAFFNSKSLQWTASLSFSFACLLLLYIRRSQLITLLPLLRVLIGVSLFVSLTALVLWQARIAQVEDARYAIVTTQRAPLYHGPGSQFKVDVNIAGGVKLKLQGVQDDWQRVILSDGREGWLARKDIRALGIYQGIKWGSKK